MNNSQRFLAILSLIAASLGLALPAHAQTPSQPDVIFNLTPDLPVQAKLVLTAYNMESKSYNCTLMIQAELRYANDATPQGTIVIPNVKLRVEKGDDASTADVGAQELIDQGVPGLRYASGRVLRSSCTPDRPAWEADIKAGYEYALVNDLWSVLNPLTKQTKSLFKAESGKAEHIAFSADGSSALLVDSIMRTVTTYELPKRQKLWSLKMGPRERVHAARLSRDGRYAIILSSTLPGHVMQVGATLRVYDTVKNEMRGTVSFGSMLKIPGLAQYDTVTFYSKNFDISPTEDILVLANPFEPSQHLTLYNLPDLNDGKSFGSYSRPQHPIFSKDGTRIATSEDDRVSVYDRESLLLLHSRYFPMVQAMDFTPSNNHLVVNNGSTFLWTLDSKKEPLELNRGPTRIYELSVSPDGKFISYSGGNPNTESGYFPFSDKMFFIYYEAIRTPEWPATSENKSEIPAIGAQSPFFGAKFTPPIPQW